jgi:hypothetical protein
MIQETKSYSLSTRSSGCQILNGDYKSNVQFDIPNMIYKDDSIEYIHYSIPYAVVPNSFYTINYRNNILNYTIGGQTYSVTFEEGNYNANYFMTQCKKLLGASGFSIVLDTISSKFTITHTNETFTFNEDSTIDFVVGFSGNISSVANVDGTYSITMSRPCNFLPLPRICFRCPQLAGDGNGIGSINTNDLILTVPNTSKPNGEIVYQNGGMKHLFKGDKIDRLNFSITDDDGLFLNFNGFSCFFVIQFDIYRKYLEQPIPFSELKTMGKL